MVDAQQWPAVLEVRTLVQAHDAVVPLRPGPDASRSAWLEFYRRSAAVYRQVAEIDSAHREHALYWAEREQAKADELAAQPGKRRGGAAGLVPATLEAAHTALDAAQPSADARTELWLAFWRHAAEVYAEVAEVDRRHHHETQYYVSRARLRAAALANHIEKKRAHVSKEDSNSPGANTGEPSDAQSTRWAPWSGGRPSTS